MNKVTALLAVKANTRVALATALVERNAECEALRAQLSAASAPAPAPAPRTPYVRPLPAHFAAAREAAMRMGKAVRVQA